MTRDRGLGMAHLAADAAAASVDVGVRARSDCARPSDLMLAWTRHGNREGRLRRGVGARRRVPEVRIDVRMGRAHRPLGHP